MGKTSLAAAFMFSNLKVTHTWFHLVRSLDPSGQGDMKDDSAEILFQSCSAGGPCEQFWHGQGHPLFDVLPALNLAMWMDMYMVKFYIFIRSIWHIPLH